MDQPGEQHYCYQCLLEDSQEQQLSDMGKLACFRRTLWIMFDRDETDSAHYTQRSFAQKLGQSTPEIRDIGAKKVAGCDRKTTAKLITRLKDEGFLTRTKFPSPIRNPERIQDRIRIYGDPFTSIGIHVGGSLTRLVGVLHSR